MTTSTFKTNSLFTSKEEYLTFVRAWKEAARNKTLTREDCLMRCLLLGQDVDKVMPLTKSELRLANGARECSGRLRAQRVMATSPFKVWAARQAHIAERKAQGKAPLDYRMIPSWGEKWVDASFPQSTLEPQSFGLSKALMEQVLDRAADNAVGWPAKAGT